VSAILGSVEGLAERVAPGVRLCLAPDYAGAPMCAVRALIARGATALHLIGLPQLGFGADLLIGAGCVEIVESAAVTLGEAGAAPCFTRAVKRGSIHLLDSTCPAIHAGLQAAEKGIPFMALRGILGSDLLSHRTDWKVIDNPYADNDPIVLVPAIRPDVALFHAPLADRRGNVWIGVRRELMLAAHAARCTLVTVEEIVPGDLLRDERMAPGTIPSLYVDAIAEARNGAWPTGLWGCYAADTAYLADYARVARDEAGFARYLKHLCAAEPVAP